MGQRAPCAAFRRAARPFRPHRKDAGITAPTLVITGDEDWPCLEPGMLMKETIPTAALLVLPNCGHTINLEEPGAFNAHVSDFLHAVDVGAWRKRDSRALKQSILGR